MTEIKDLETVKDFGVIRLIKHEGYNGIVIKLLKFEQAFLLDTFPFSGRSDAKTLDKTLLNLFRVVAVINFVGLGYTWGAELQFNLIEDALFVFGALWSVGVMGTSKLSFFQSNKKIMWEAW